MKLKPVLNLFSIGWMRIHLFFLKINIYLKNLRVKYLNQDLAKKKVKLSEYERLSAFLDAHVDNIHIIRDLVKETPGLTLEELDQLFSQADFDALCADEVILNTKKLK